MVIVNVASECGFTNANYSQLKEILDQYKSKGLEVAAFPCNQFGGQVGVSRMVNKADKVVNSRLGARLRARREELREEQVQLRA